MSNIPDSVTESIQIDSTKLDRARGSLAGLAIGDALGRPVEGLSLKEIEYKYGEITEFLDDEIQGTDDTEFAILTATSLIQFGLTAESKDFATGWLRNVCGQVSPLSGAGFSELSTMRNLQLGIKPPLSGMHSASWSDGLAMRIAPVGIAANHDYELVKRLATADGEVSNAGEGIFAGIAVALAVALAINGESTDRIFRECLVALPATSWLHRNLLKVEEIFENRADKPLKQIRHELISTLAIEDFPFPELAPEAVALAFGVIKFAGESVEEALLFAVNLGRDTDTIAAIAGAILGAKYGFESIPKRWTSQLKPATGSCLEFAAGIDLVGLAPNLLQLGIN